MTFPTTGEAPYGDKVKAYVDDLIASVAVQILQGSVGVSGASTLVDGSVVVVTDAVTPSSRIFVSVQTLGTVSVPQAVAVTERAAGVSFTISSADATDTSDVVWRLIEP